MHAACERCNNACLLVFFVQQNIALLSAISDFVLLLLFADAPMQNFFQRGYIGYEVTVDRWWEFILFPANWGAWGAS